MRYVVLPAPEFLIIDLVQNYRDEDRDQGLLVIISSFLFAS